MNDCSFENQTWLRVTTPTHAMQMVIDLKYNIIKAHNITLFHLI